MFNIVILIISAIFGSLGQILLKQAASSIALQGNYVKYFLGLLTNIYAWSGAFSYVASFALYMIALNKTELSIARSISALSYVFVILISFFLFRDTITPLKIIAIVLITAGIFLLGFDMKL